MVCTGTVVKQAMRQMGTAVPLKEWLAESLLIYRTTSHAMTERCPDDTTRLKTSLTLIFPNLAPTVEHHQRNQKAAHDGKKPL